ncbi:MAG: HNH endonuclease domain-containing protein, partial [Dysgonamonadaceae bacterium]|nr:HNH endonuclease domain-containing protein [Dysgonamonadaceae bacterium]
PDLFEKCAWEKFENDNLIDFYEITKKNKNEREIFGITNNLISRFKINSEYVFAYKNVEYDLQPSDFDDIEEAISENYGRISWEKKLTDKKQKIIYAVAKHYQNFFRTSKRDYFIIPKMRDSFKTYLASNFLTFNCSNNHINQDDSSLKCECNGCKKLNKIYHHSQIQVYKPSSPEKILRNGCVFYVSLLQSPVVGAIKNPMAMRVMHTLRKQVNNLIIEGIIDEDTNVVVEVARDLNDANKRWAISAYQGERENENKEFEAAITELLKDPDFTGKADPNNKNDIDKVRLWIELANGKVKRESIPKYYESYKQDSVKKYRLWKEQNFTCVYTGLPIKLSDLFSENKIEIEHTVPRSISFDNSMANLTVCYSHYNREVKKNKIPAELDDYQLILSRIQPWVDKVENLKDNIEHWRGQSKSAQDKERKDFCIRQRHMWQMELNYWRNKVARFTMSEVTAGFKNSQLVDTRLISKYAFHYLKSVFNRVDVQKGTVTSDFRKMLGVQSINDNKDRNKHSHHAIDAAVLTLIPSSAKRDKMLKLYYEIEEAKVLWRNAEEHKFQLENEISGCNFGSVSGISSFIENNIIVNHLSKDQTLTPAVKKHRARGKIVPQRSVEGKVILEKKKKGKLVPKAKFIQTGDSIRGKLHDETFYGAITQGKKDVKGSLIRDENGQIISNKEIIYVIRKELKYKKNPNDTGFKAWSDLEKVIVDKSLFKIMRNQFSNNTNFKDACEKGIWMIDRNGNKVNKIRRVRCIAKINPIQIRKQTYLSKKEYKRYYYAKNGENLYYALYWNGRVNNKKTYAYISLMDLSNMHRNTNGTEIENNFEPFKKIGKGRNIMEAPIYDILKNGSRLLVFKEDELSNKSQTLSVEDYKELLSQLDPKDLNKRLYIFKRLFPDDGRIQLKFHLDSRDDKQLLADFPNDGKKGSNGFSEVNLKNPYPKLLLSLKNIFFLREYKDFIIESGEIKIL